MHGNNSTRNSTQAQVPMKTWCLLTRFLSCINPLTQVANAAAQKRAAVAIAKTQATGYRQLHAWTTIQTAQAKTHKRIAPAWPTSHAHSTARPA
ncbi:MAG: hypothetical protein DCE87_09165 [Betaproteobacteria bacterium]|nr:MAG: hypothetical protein DCE87_09165 [Betaproteobacteria bacterium]